jgi:hypothetical protein
MRRGILLPKDKTTPTINEWARAGIRKFMIDERTRGYDPAQIQVNPQDNGFPSGFAVDGLPVVCNAEIRPGHLRVCTVDLGEDI